MGRVAVYKRCGCKTRKEVGELGASCPQLAERGHGSWYFSLELPCGRDGRRHRVRRGGFRSRAAAEQARAYQQSAHLREALQRHGPTDRVVYYPES